MRLGASRIASAVLFSLLSLGALQAADKPFHDAPASAKAEKNPYEGQAAAVGAGKQVYARNCLACHGKAGQGTGNVPSLVDGKLEGVSAGEIFWFITKGDKDNGMPAWASLPEQARWRVVTYVEAMASGKAAGSQRHEGEGCGSERPVH
jgi:mono/diheme cytochrome c family protein